VWGLQRGTSVIPKSVTEGRIQSNFELDGVKLSDAEMKELSSLPDRFKVCGDSWLPVKVSHSALLLNEPRSLTSPRSSSATTSRRCRKGYFADHNDGMGYTVELTLYM